MTKTRNEILEKIKNLHPHMSNDEAKQLLETRETYCELVINYTLKNGGDDEDN